ncbi:MAG: sugar phosphate isomerase/epimerase [Bacteroidales bacterium]|nr:sugar phosphate isomerase/epimerase [Bacteroidales bacterium]
MYKRRQFIKTLSAGSLACFLPWRVLFAGNGNNKKIGLQLYTIRDQMEKDVEGSLGSVSNIGYNYLEAAGYRDGKLYNMKPSKFANLIKRLHMRLISSHVSVSDENIDEVIEAHTEAGCKYIILPYLAQSERKELDDYKRLAEKLNRLGERTAQANIRIGYHNHDFEFEELEGQKGFDVLLNDTDPELVTFEIDLFWVFYAGINPMKYLENHPGRFELWHIKDMNNREDKDFTEVGNGIIDFEMIFDAAQRAGMKYFFVEQDMCKKPPMESIQISYDNLVKMNL